MMKTCRRTSSLRAISILAVLTALTGLTCDEPFSSGSLDPQLVIFSVLSTDRDAQYVRVHSNYMPKGSDPSSYPSDNAVTNVTVLIRDPDSTWVLADTLLVRRDTTRFTSQAHAYVLTPFIPENGKRYEVQVQSPFLGTALGSAIIPGKSQVTIDAVAEGVLRIPLRFPPQTVVRFNVRFSKLSKAYIVRSWVYYDVLLNGQWVEERMEVPTGSTAKNSYSLEYARYAGLVLTPNATDYEIKYDLGFYQEVIREITTRRHKDNRIIYKWLSLVILQTDDNLYRYYSAVHEYQDPRSVRLDEPIYSPINGGYGMVGAYALDSLLYILPSNFDGNR